MDESSNDRINKSQALVVVVLTLSLFLGVTLGHSNYSSEAPKAGPPSAISEAPPNSNPMNTRIAVDPYAIIDLQRQLTDVVFTLNLTNSPPINGFSVVLSYSYSFLHASSLDYSGNILEQIPNQNQYQTRNCLDGAPGAGGPGECTLGDGPGITAFTDTSIGPRLTQNNTSGSLFTLHLAPVAAGFTQIVVKSGLIFNSSNVQLPVSTFGGYYTSIDCPSGSGNPCKPSSPDFTWFPNNPAVRKPVAFYGNITKTSTGVTIKDYSWNFGDLSGDVTTDTGMNSTSQHIFYSTGTFLVTLTVNDSFSIVSSITHRLVVHSDIVEIGISNIIVDPSTILLLPGAKVTITAFVHNYGAKNVSDTATLTLDGRQINKTSIVNLRPTSEVTITAVWDTTGYHPNAYRLDAYVPPVTNQTDTSHNLKTVWIQLIPPNPGGLGMWPTGAIGISVLGVLGYGVSRLRRRGVPLEPL